MARAVFFLILALRCWADCKFPDSAAAAAPVSVESLLDAGHYQRAKAQIPPNPDDARTLWLLSRAESGLGHLEAALKLVDQAVALDSTKPEYHVQLAASNGRLAERASMFKQLGYAKRAKKALDTAIQLNPESMDALYGLMLFYYAAPSFIGGDKQKALEAADRIARLDPARGYLAQAHLAKERKDQAAEESFYRKAIEADPVSYEAKIALARFDLSRGYPLMEAEQQACEAVGLDSDRIDAWRVLAEIEVRNQCWSELFDLFDRAKVLVPDDASYQYSAGAALIRLGMHAGWAQQFLSAYILGPRENDEFLAPAHFHLAEAFRRLDRAEEAQAEVAKAMELDPGLGNR